MISEETVVDFEDRLQKILKHEDQNEKFKALTEIIQSVLAQKNSVIVQSLSSSLLPYEKELTEKANKANDANFEGCRPAISFLRALTKLDKWRSFLKSAPQLC